MEKSLQTKIFLSTKWETEGKLKEKVESDEEHVCWTSYQCTTK